MPASFGSRTGPFLNCTENAVQQVHGRRGTSGNDHIDRDDLIYSAQRCIALAENTAVAPAITYGNNQLGRRRCVICPAERYLHIPRDRPGNQQEVRKSRRGSEMDTKPLAVVKRVVDGMDLQLAAIAGACIDLPDGKASLKASFDSFLKPCPRNPYFLFCSRRQRFRHYAGPEYLAEDPYHDNLPKSRK